VDARGGRRGDRGGPSGAVRADRRLCGRRLAGGIIVNLLTKSPPDYYDIALRDFGLMLAALTLGRLSLAVVPARKAGILPGRFR
jgi:dodecin